MSRKKEKKKRPVIVVEGAPEWMVTFGDLMSLLLTFFVLLFSISEIKSEKIFDVVVAFRSQFEIDVDAESVLLDFSDVTELLSSLSNQMPDRSEGHKGKSAQNVENPFGKHASIHRVKDDFHIDIEGSVLFAPGSSELEREGIELVEDIRRRLQGGYNRIRILVDPSPTEGGIDETTLAFQRARAVYDVMTTEDGVDPVRIEVGARGSGDPVQVREVIEPERRAARDRVVIILTPEPVRELQELRKRQDEARMKGAKR